MKKRKSVKKTSRSSKKLPSVTIIIPTHSAPVTTIVDALQQQEYNGDVTILILDNGPIDRTKEIPKGATYIKNEKNIGLAGSLNKGIRLSRSDYILTLHQDCVPQGNDWLTTLMKPFDDPAVIVSSSQQILPREVWKKFSFWHKVFAVPELSLVKGVYERATTFNREAVIACGLFDNVTFSTAGEDTDLFMKLKEKGRFVVSDALVAHEHAPHNDSLWKFINTFLRCHEGMGVLHRKYLLRMGFQFWYDLFRTLLFLFFVVFLFYVPVVSLGIFIGIVVLANVKHTSVFRYIRDLRLVFVPFVYTFVWFATLFVTWKGFVTGVQRIE
jgi:GT2 family glycosyltransferase